MSAMMRAVLAAWAASCVVLDVFGCSTWYMENSYKISGRTKDFTSFEWGWVSVPAGSMHSAQRGPNTGKPVVHATLALAVLNKTTLAPTVTSLDAVNGGINDAGLSCDGQALEGGTYPPRSGTDRDLPATAFCGWALEAWGSALQVKAALEGGAVVVYNDEPGGGGGHFSVRDANTSIVVEFVNHTIQVYVDGNDGGATGFGVLTNEPGYAWQLASVRNFLQKEARQRPAVAMPGGWYPDERFLRLAKVKAGLLPPATYERAVADAVTVMNTVTVPSGQQIGTDATCDACYGGGGTAFGIIYDHRQRLVYWRTAGNPSMQRLRLQDVPQHEPVFLPLLKSDLPFFSNAAHAVIKPGPKGAVIKPAQPSNAYTYPPFGPGKKKRPPLAQERKNSP